MATTAKNILKGWFENGDFPNQEQFWAWMESYWHKAEEIPMSVIMGLATVLAGKATTQDIDNVNQRIDNLIESPTGAVTERSERDTDLDYLLVDGQLLEKVVLIPVSDITLSVGTTDGGNDIVPDQVCPGGMPSVMAFDRYADGDTHVYFSGINVTTKIIIFKRV